MGVGLRTHRTDRQTARQKDGAVMTVPYVWTSHTLHTWKRRRNRFTVR